MGTRLLSSRFLTSTSFIFILLALLVVFPYSASALDIVENVNLANEYVQPYWRDNNTSTWVNTSKSYSRNGDYSSTSWVMIRSGSNANISASVGEYYSFVATVIATANASGQYNKSAFIGVSNSNTDCNILDLEVEEVSATPMPNTSTEQRSVRYTVSGFCRVTTAISQGPSINFYTSSAPTSNPLSYTVQFHNLSKWTADTSISTINTRLNEIKTSLNNIFSTLNTMGITLDNIYGVQNDSLNALNDLRDAQEQANDDANDRYNDEKDIINNSASDAETNASGQDFSFTIPNPLQSWFGSFSDSECVNIPNLAVWLHSNETRICTPWPSSVRTVMTTIVTGLFMLLLFSFIISWVKKNDTGGN